MVVIKRPQPALALGYGHVAPQQVDRPGRRGTVPATETRQGLRALHHDHAASPGPARAYVERALGDHLPAVRRAMERLAASMPPEELNRVGFRLDERFRPEVPEGARGWGAKGVLDLKRIEDAGR